MGKKQVFEEKSRNSFELIEFGVSIRHPSGHDQYTHTLEPQAWNSVEKEMYIWARRYRFGSGQHTCDSALRLDVVTQGVSVAKEEG